MSVLGRLCENISLRTQVNLERHHNGLAQWIDRWVGDLRKLLSEIVVQRPFLSRENGHGCVIPHRADCFITRFCQWPEHLISLLEADLKHLLVNIELRAVNGRDGLSSETALDQTCVLPEPFFVGLPSLQ